MTERTCKCSSNFSWTLTERIQNTRTEMIKGFHTVAVISRQRSSLKQTCPGCSDQGSKVTLLCASAAGASQNPSAAFLLDVSFLPSFLLVLVSLLFMALWWVYRNCNINWCVDAESAGCKDKLLVTSDFSPSKNMQSHNSQTVQPLVF